MDAFFSSHSIHKASWLNLTNEDLVLYSCSFISSFHLIILSLLSFHFSLWSFRFSIFCFFIHVSSILASSLSETTHRNHVSSPCHYWTPRVVTGHAFTFIEQDHAFSGWLLERYVCQSAKLLGLPVGCLAFLVGPLPDNLCIIISEQLDSIPS